MFKLLFAGLFVLSSNVAFARLDKAKLYGATHRLAQTMGLSLTSKQVERDIIGEYGCRVRAEIRRAHESTIEEMVISIKNVQFILHDYYTLILTGSSSDTQLKFETGYSDSFPDMEVQTIGIEEFQGNARITITQGGRKEVCGGLNLSLIADQR